MNRRHRTDGWQRRAAAAILALAIAVAPTAALAQAAPQCPTQRSGGGASGGSVDVDEAGLALDLLKWAARKKREADARKKAEEAARKEAEARLAAEAAAAPPPPAPETQVPKTEPAPTAPPAVVLTPAPSAPPPTVRKPVVRTPKPAPKPAARAVEPAPPVEAPPPPMVAPPAPPPVAAAAPPAPAPVPPPSAPVERDPWPASLAWLAVLIVAAITAAFAARRILGWGAPPPTLVPGVDVGVQDEPAFATPDGPHLAVHASRGAFDTEIAFEEAAE